jgi:nucleotide-binding universal stress UspA family protein
LSVLTGIPVETSVLLGSPEAALLEEISARQADLVVMTSRGRTGLGRWVMGSVARQMVRCCEIPLLVLREQGATLATSRPDLEHLFRILVCLDGGAWAETSLEPAAHLALAMSESNQAGLHAAKQYLAGVSRRLQQTYPSLTITWSVGVGMDTAATITRMAESGEDVEGTGVFGGCDIIALTTHGRIGTARLALGSVAQRVVDISRLPILILHPPAGGETTA